MLNSVLKSVLQLFKVPVNGAALEAENESQATRYDKRKTSKAMGCNETIPGLISGARIAINGTTLLGYAGIENSATDNAEIHTMDLQNDTRHVKRMDADKSSARITINGDNRSRDEYRIRAFTVDESLLESAKPICKVRHHDPGFYSDRLVKCVSLPNIFRTTSIQDKSMKITHKRRERKHARLRQTRSKCNSSESENESNEIKRNAIEDNRIENSDVERTVNDTDYDKNYKRTSLNVCKYKSLDSLMDDLKDDGSTSDSDEYYSCYEEIIDDNDRMYSKKHKTKKLHRISSIQKRSWSIRQKRRENLFKRRSVDIAT